MPEATSCLGVRLPRPAARRRLAAPTRLHQEVRRLRRGHPRDLDDRPAAARSAPTSRSAASSSARCSASTPTATAPSCTLGIYPDQIDTIPRNVTGSIVPKTLFGEKYVSLVDPDGRRPRGRIQAGDDDHRAPRCSIEVEKVLTDLYPLLRTVQPADINHDPQRDRRPRSRAGASELGAEPRDRRRLPQADQPADPGARRGPAADRAGLRHLRRRAARGRRRSCATPSRPPAPSRTARPELNALFNDVAGVLRHRPRASSTHNGDNMIRLGQLGAAAARSVLAQLRPGVPLPARRHRQRRQARRPRRSAASPCTSSSRRCPTSRAATTPADEPGATATTAGPNCAAPAQPALDQANPVRHQPELRRRRRRAHRQGHRPRRARLRPARRHRRRLRRQPRRDRPAQVAARPGARRARRPTCPTSACCWSGRWLAGAEVVAAMKRCLDQQDLRIDLTKLLIFIVVTTLATGVLVVTSATSASAATHGLQGRVRRRHRRRQGRRHPHRRRQGRHGQGASRSSTAPARWSPSPSQSDTALDQATHADDPLPQPRRPALHLADPGGRRAPASCPRAPRSRSPQTTPALDLTVLFNGFKPLFQALSPADINKLSYEIVQVFQGEGGTLEGLLAHTASVTYDAGRPRPGDRRA